MEKKYKLILWIAIDVLLLIGLLIVSVKWISLNQRINSPCDLCLKSYPEKQLCFREQSRVSAFQINFSEIEIKEIKNYSLPLT